MNTNHTSIVLALFTSALICASPTRAETHSPGPGRHLEGAEAIDRIATLTHFVVNAWDASTDEYRDAQIERWTLAADLVILAHLREDRSLRSRVAEALREPPATLEQAVLDGLTYVPVSVESDPAEEAERGIRFLAQTRGGPRRWQTHQGLWRDLFYVLATQRALEDPQGPVAGLAALVPDDSVAEPGGEASYAVFGAESRRAIRAMVEARGALGRLRSAERSGPVWSAAEEELEAARLAIEGVSQLRPPLRLGGDLDLVGVDDGGEVSRPSLIVVVGPTGFRYGWAPSVRFSDGGRTSLVGRGRPLLPETREIRFGAEPRPIPRPLSAAVHALSDLSSLLQHGDEVAIGCEPSTPAHVLSRMMLSLDRAGVPTSALLARASDGGVRTIEVNVLRSREEVPSSLTRVHVRLGGYTVRRRRARIDVPRVRREDDEGWRFDVDGLLASVADSSSERIALSSMGTVDTAEVFVAAFALSPEDALSLALY